MVITFLPFPDIEKSLRVLDDRRLGKQRVEARQMYDAITNPNAKGWKNHPAALMWKGHEDLLALYFNTSVDLWLARGKNNNMPYLSVDPERAKNKPMWWGWKALHCSHMAALIRKDPLHYEKPLGKYVGGYRDYGYLWPTHVEYDKLDVVLPDRGDRYIHWTSAINIRQLLPFCAQTGCRNRIRKYVLSDGRILNDHCGVHCKNRKKQ